AVSKLRKFYLLNRRLPSYSELATLFHYASRNAAVRLAQKLLTLGVIAKDETGKLIPRKLFAIPHFGSIQAGYPTDPSPIESDLDVYQFLLNLPSHTFSLTVSGNSMSNAGIHEGDLVIVAKDRQPRN